MQLPQTNSLAAHVSGDLVYYSFPALDAIPFVRHGFSTRLGGVSQGIFASMNLSFTRGDETEAVKQNFDRFCTALDVRAENVVISAQEHHTAMHNATAADRGRGITRERGYTDIDGLLTDEPGVVLCTQYADCVPLFFADPVRRVVATSHSGWKGTVQRIGAVTVERMCADYGCRREDIVAGIGPSVGPCCFEVDAPVVEAFSAMEECPESCIRPTKPDKYHIDLWEINRRILLAVGVTFDHITVTDLCTRSHPDLFWSHRMLGKERGSLAGMIAIAE